MKENKSVIIGVRLTPEEKRKLELLCAAREVNISTLIRELIEEEIKKEQI